MKRKFKYLLSCGCSWMQGYGVEGKLKHRLSNIISDKYELENINISEGGASNEFTLRKITEWLSNNRDKAKETFILIGLTESTRYEYWLESQKQYSKGHPGSVPHINWEEHRKFAEFHLLNVGMDMPQLWKTYQIIIQLKSISKYFGSEILKFESLGGFNKQMLKFNEELDNSVDNWFRQTSFSDMDIDFIFDKNYYGETSWEDALGGQYNQHEKDDFNVKYYNHENNDGHPNKLGNEFWSKKIIEHMEKKF